MSPVRYKAQTSSLKSNLPAFLNQKLVAECEGRIETVIPDSSPIHMAEKVPFEIEVYEGRKKVKALNFADIDLRSCVLKLNDSEVSVITDAEDITISIDGISGELPASKIISLRSLNDEKLHTVQCFLNLKSPSSQRLMFGFRGITRRWMFSLKIMSVISRKFLRERITISAC